MMAIDSEQQEQKPERQLDHRYDAFAKVTGQAKYAAEFPVKNVAYALSLIHI